MPSNVEIKAKVHDVEKLKKLAESFSGEQGTVIIQNDVFFNVPNGRLKLRKLENSPSQLIFYQRDNQPGPKLSDYYITYTETPEDLKLTLSKALGIKGIVKKRRLLYVIGQTRLHVDHVEDLGHYMELEVCLKEGQSVEEGQWIADDLMTKLEISKEDLIEGAYLDLLLNNKHS